MTISNIASNLELPDLANKKAEAHLNLSLG